jgi:hypothetical protein
MTRPNTKTFLGSACLAMVLVHCGIAEMKAAVSGALYARWALVDITPDRPGAISRSTGRWR